MKNDSQTVLRAVRRFQAEEAVNLRQRRAWFEGEPSATGQEPNPSAAPSAPQNPPDGGAGDMPDWVKDPAKAYAEIQKLRTESATYRTTARELDDRMKKLEAEEKKKQDAKLVEQNEWKTLAEQRAAEVEDWKKKYATKERETTLMTVATDLKIPKELAARLQGSTEEEIRADAASLIEALGLNKTPAPQETPATTSADSAGNPSAPADQRKPNATTTANPSGQPVGRTDADRRSEYFQKPNSSPIFEKTGGGVIFHGNPQDMDQPINKK